MTSEQWAARFPGVEFVEGRAAALDDHGNRYFTYSIGGVRNDLDPIPYAVNMPDEVVVETFVRTMREIIGDSKYVLVRKWPQMDKTVVWYLETSETEVPTLLPLTKVKITARFSIYKEKP